MSHPGDATIRSDSGPARPVRFGAAMLALGLGGFSIGTGEFVIMGLLPEVAGNMAVSIPDAGHAISAYALGVVIGAPVLAVLGARHDRRQLLMALMLAYALGNIASALAPGFASLIALRFVSGMPHGTYFGVAALVAASLAPPGRRARAVGLVLLGLTSATLLGVPLAAWLGQTFGWRAAFLFVGAVGLLAVSLLYRAIPSIPPIAGASAMRELGALRRKQVWFTLGIAAVGFGGMFAVYSYIKPILTEVSGVPLAGVPLVLAAFGLGMVVGNIVGARLADRSLRGTIGGLLVYAIVVLAVFPVAAQHVVGASAGLFLIGTFVAIGPALQIRLMDVAGDAQTLAAALNHSAFNTANALGAWLGGLAISAGFGWTSTAWVGAAMGVVGLLVFVWSMLSEPATPKQA